MKILVTGGAGFIGSTLVKHLLREPTHTVLNLDKLTYAGGIESLAAILPHPRHRFERVDITDGDKLKTLFESFQPDAVMHLAAETHVDRSLDSAESFLHTNIWGTYQLLRVSHHYWKNLPVDKKAAFRFLHVSTDEVYGSLGSTGLFSELSPYLPNSPYSASKASSDHLVRAWHHSYGLPTLVTHCSNNYGPFQFPEKLIPVVIIKALAGQSIPVYGHGNNVRDWIYVGDHVEGLERVLMKGIPGEVYNLGGNCERTNLEIVHAICDLLPQFTKAGPQNYRALITHVADRPGHDQRYAVDIQKVGRELDWQPREDFQSGMRQTVRWYLENRVWWEKIRKGVYSGERLGLAA